MDDGYAISSLAFGWWIYVCSMAIKCQTIVPGRPTSSPCNARILWCERCGTRGCINEGQDCPNAGFGGYTRTGESFGRCTTCMGVGRPNPPSHNLGPYSKNWFWARKSCEAEIPGVPTGSPCNAEMLRCTDCLTEGCTNRYEECANARFSGYDHSSENVGRCQCGSVEGGQPLGSWSVPNRGSRGTGRGE